MAAARVQQVAPPRIVPPVLVTLLEAKSCLPNNCGIENHSPTLAIDTGSFACLPPGVLNQVMNFLGFQDLSSFTQTCANLQHSWCTEEIFVRFLQEKKDDILNTSCVRKSICRIGLLLQGVYPENEDHSISLQSLQSSDRVLCRSIARVFPGKVKVRPCCVKRVVFEGAAPSTTRYQVCPAITSAAETSLGRVLYSLRIAPAYHYLMPPGETLLEESKAWSYQTEYFQLASTDPDDANPFCWPFYYTSFATKESCIQSMLQTRPIEGRLDVVATDQASHNSTSMWCVASCVVFDLLDPLHRDRMGNGDVSEHDYIIEV